MNTFPIYSLDVQSQKHAERVVAQLWSLSCWFAVTPLPDDAWRITVKDEYPLTEKLCDLANTTEPRGILYPKEG